MSTDQKLINEALNKTRKSYREILAKFNQFFISEKRNLASREDASNLLLINQIEVKNKEIQSARIELKSQEEALSRLKERLRQLEISIKASERELKYEGNVALLKERTEKAKKEIGPFRKTHEVLQKQILETQSTLLKNYEENREKILKDFPKVASDLTSPISMEATPTSKVNEEDLRTLRSTFKKNLEQFKQAASKTKSGFLQSNDVSSMIRIKRVEVEEEDIQLVFDEVESQEEILSSLKEWLRQLEISIKASERELEYKGNVTLLKERVEKAKKEIGPFRENRDRLQEQISGIRANLFKIYQEGIEKIRQHSSKIGLDSSVPTVGKTEPEPVEPIREQAKEAKEKIEPPIKERDEIQAKILHPQTGSDSEPRANREPISSQVNSMDVSSSATVSVSQANSMPVGKTEATMIPAEMPKTSVKVSSIPTPTVSSTPLNSEVAKAPESKSETIPFERPVLLSSPGVRSITRERNAEEVNKKIEELGYKSIMDGLEAYIGRIEKTTKGFTDFESDFWFDARARGLNRRINCALAKKLKDDIISYVGKSENTEADIKKHVSELFKEEKINELRKEIVEKVIQEPDPKRSGKKLSDIYAERGIQSSELNKVLETARDITHRTSPGRR